MNAVLHPKHNGGLRRTEGRHSEDGYREAELRVRGKPEAKEREQADRNEQEYTAPVKEDPEVARAAEGPEGLPLELDPGEKSDPTQSENQERTDPIQGGGIQDSEKGTS